MIALGVVDKDNPTMTDIDMYAGKETAEEEEEIDYLSLNESTNPSTMEDASPKNDTSGKGNDQAGNDAHELEKDAAGGGNEEFDNPTMTYNDTCAEKETATEEEEDYLSLNESANPSTMEDPSPKNDTVVLKNNEVEMSNDATELEKDAAEGGDEEIENQGLGDINKEQNSDSAKADQSDQTTCQATETEKYSAVVKNEVIQDLAPSDINEEQMSDSTNVNKGDQVTCQTTEVENFSVGVENEEIEDITFVDINKEQMSDSANVNKSDQVTCQATGMENDAGRAEKGLTVVENATNKTDQNTSQEMEFSGTPNFDLGINLRSPTPPPTRQTMEIDSIYDEITDEDLLKVAEEFDKIATTQEQGDKPVNEARQVMDEVKKMPTNKTKQITERLRKPSHALRSPYKERVVPLHMDIDADDLEIIEYATDDTLPKW